MSETITRSKTGSAGGFGGAPSYGLPPCGVEDVDAAVLRAVSTDMNLQVADKDGEKPVRAIFAAGERWSQIKRGVMLRDANGSLILPLIAVIRSSVTQDPSEDVAGRGINQHTGMLRVTRRYVKREDSAYQRLTNSRAVAGSGVWRSPQAASSLTRSSVGDLAAEDRNVAAGGVMLSDARSAIIETVTVPSPQFYSVKYDVKIWTAYTQHMNQIAEKFMASYLPCDRALKLVTDKGYWFVAYVDSSDFASETNADSVGDGERIIRGSMQLRVPAYLVATSGHGGAAPVRSVRSKPDVSFVISDVSEGDGVQEPFLGSDDPTLQMTSRRTRRRDGRAELGAADPAWHGLRRGQSPSLFSRDRRATVTKIDDKYHRSQVISEAAGETAHSGLSLADFVVSVD